MNVSSHISIITEVFKLYRKPRPKAETNNTHLDLDNFLAYSQPHPIIANNSSCYTDLHPISVYCSELK